VKGGKAVRIVAPLLTALPPGLPCRVIPIERDIDEVLDSQQRLLKRRPLTRLPEVEHSLISDPIAMAEKVKRFLGEGLDVAGMAAAVDPKLHRNRAT
jgi:hypothetical protein